MAEASSKDSRSGQNNRLRKRVGAKRATRSQPDRSKDDAFAGLSSAAQPPPKRSKPQWLFWALTSGGFAAFNGVFAKLTTAGRTQVLAELLARWTGSIDNAPVFEIVARAIFFGLNILSNAIMWILFTRALTAASSTTRVSILNTSANFLVTALLGMCIFGERLPLAWWLGASLLVAGSVIIGAREEKDADSAGVQSGVEGRIALSADQEEPADSQADDVEPYKDQPATAAGDSSSGDARRSILPIS